jgi:hypothetical protein
VTVDIYQRWVELKLQTMDTNIDDVPRPDSETSHLCATTPMDFSSVVELCATIPYPGKNGYKNPKYLKGCLAMRRNMVEIISDFPDMIPTNLMMYNIILHLADFYIRITPEAATKFAQLCIDYSKDIPCAKEFALSTLLNFTISNDMRRVMICGSLNISLMEGEKPSIGEVMDCFAYLDAGEKVSSGSINNSKSSTLDTAPTVAPALKLLRSAFEQSGV